MFATLSRRWQIAPLHISRWGALLIGAWALAMISLPIMKWVWGPHVLPIGLTLGVALQATAVFVILLKAWGWADTVRTAVLVGVSTLLIEMLGSRTGFPFGPYAYTDLMQPQLGHVPLLIPLAWFMMLPSAWAVAAIFRRRLWLFALVSAGALTAWDLFLDPQMAAWGVWIWENPSGYFGIPWSNYAGWLGTAVFVTLLVRPKPLPVRPLLVIYAITWFLETFGLLFFWGLIGPALVGGVVMGAFMLFGWQQALRGAAARPAEA